MSSTPTPLPSDNDALFDSYIHSNAYLDHQSFCSNFSCCGQTLPDLHQLIDHFEDVHVLPLAPDADYARPVGPHPSYILSYPQPDPPLHQVFLPAHVPDLVYSPPSATSPSPPSSCYPSPSLGEPLCLPPALFSFQPPRPCTPPPTTPHRSRIAANPLSGTQSDRTPATARSATRPQRTAKHPLPRSRPLPHERPPVPHSASGTRRRDGREKMYKCPHPGCTKSYLNPNGLKYHLEKGTCTNAETRRRAPLPPTVAAAALAPGASVPALSSVAPSPEPPAAVGSSPTMTDDEGGDGDGGDALVART